MPIRTLLAACAGALIEAYDFFLFGVMAVIFAELFFPAGDGLMGLLKSMGTVWIGLAIRPVGAVVFGALGDRIGRKSTFIFTLLLMGVGTGGVGFLPTYAQSGYWAPAMLVALRILQGLAYGGEYGGAAISIAENAPDGRRGFYTSFIQVTAAAGFLLALGSVLAVQYSMSAQDFLSFGWRIPFLLAALLVVVSGIIRGKMRESPLFVRAKALGLTSRRPIFESLGSKRNLRLILLAIFGGTVAQSVIFYTSEVYAGVFLQKTLKVDFLTTNLCLGIALALSTPMFVVFGLNGFFHFIPQPPPANPLALQFLIAVGTSHFALFFFAVQVVAGVLLLSGFFVPLALILLAAELYNILAFHLTLAPGAAPGVIACVLWVLVFVQYRASFQGVLSAKPAVQS